MDHPLRKEDNSDLRKRVIQLLRGSYSVPRSGNIIFVCGGNDPEHMRPRFRGFCETELSEFDVFFPEYAMEDHFSGGDPEPLDIADFEELVGELSHAIVIFPEAPGSFAETGYFSAIESLSSKTILAMNSLRQGQDSFISMGPAKKIGLKSKFQPNIQVNYCDPNFADIASRIKARWRPQSKKVVSMGKFSDLSSYELFCLVHKIVQILSIANIGDILFVMRGLFQSKVSEKKIKNITSILVGSAYLRAIGEYGHYAPSVVKGNLLTTRNGYVEGESAVRIELAALYEGGDPEFLEIVEESRNAG